MARDTRSLDASGTRRAVSAEEVEAVQAACRTLVAISARAIAAVEDRVDLTQYRILVILIARAGMSLGELAEAAGLHLSTASRTCERMVNAGLVNRFDDPANRRQVTLTATAAGRRVVQTVLRRRRAALESILAELEPTQRASLAACLREFAAVSGEPESRDLWSLGWTD